MPRLILDEEQAQFVAQLHEQVQVCDPAGKVLGYLSPVFNEADIAEARRRLASDQPRHTTQEVLAHLHSLEP